MSSPLAAVDNDQALLQGVSAGFWFLVAAWVVLWIVCMVSILRSAYPFSVRLIGVIASFAMPLLAFIIWFGFARRRQPARGVHDGRGDRRVGYEGDYR